MEIWPDMIFIRFPTRVEARDRNVGKMELARPGTAFQVSVQNILDSYSAKQIQLWEPALWAPDTLADILFFKFCLLCLVWEGWFSFVPHVFPIKSYKTPIKIVTKYKKFSQVQLTETFCTNTATYRGCHIHRKMWFNSFWWPWKCFSQLLLRNKLLSFQVTLPWNDLPSGRRGTMCCVQDDSAHLWSNFYEMQILKYLKRNLNFQIIRLDLASQSNPWKSKKESSRYKHH